MTKDALYLINLIEQQKTNNEICEILNITPKQLATRLTNLKNKGFFFKRRYFSNGELLYFPIKKPNQIKDLKKNNSSIIYTSHQDTSLKVLLISDLHFGSSKQRLDLINEAFNYCIKNDIHLIFCCGDIIDGTFSQSEQLISIPYKQTEFFLKNYPSEKNIFTFSVTGDHDSSALQNHIHQDISEIINNYRHDIIMVMDNEHHINIKNDELTLYHKLPQDYFKESTIYLCGHMHNYSCKLINNQLIISVPSLSNIKTEIPSMIEMNLLFHEGLINSINLKQLLFLEKLLLISENNYTFLVNNSRRTSIANEEEIKVKKL